MGHYVNYSDRLETILADEEAVIGQIVESMAKVNSAVFDRNRHAMRDAHAKSHGILKGTVVIADDLPVHLSQGFFARPGTYDAIIRFSSAPGEIGSDADPSPRGFALKILEVSGERLLLDQPGHSQDILLVNSPAIAFGDIYKYQKLQELVEAKEFFPDQFASLQRKLRSGGDPMLQLVLAQLAAVNSNHILGETYHSMAAIRYGDYVAKMSLVPASREVAAFSGKAVDASQGAQIFRDLIVDFFRSHSAEYHLRVQLCTDTASMPIEDASVVWPEHASPHQIVARIVIPSQEAYSPARRVYGDDVLSFNSWNSLAAHRPLGSIMRVRRTAYEKSTQFRHAMNMRPRIEPSHISELPN